MLLSYNSSRHQPTIYLQLLLHSNIPYDHSPIIILIIPLLTHSTLPRPQRLRQSPGQTRRRRISSTIRSTATTRTIQTQSRIPRCGCRRWFSACYRSLGWRCWRSGFTAMRRWCRWTGANDGWWWRWCFLFEVCRGCPALCNAVCGEPPTYWTINI